MIQAQASTIQQTLADNLNANVQISAYCSAITNTTVAPSKGAWYQPFMTNLATAQVHASLYVNTIGPDAWSTIPNAIVTYGQTYQTSMGFVQQIMQNAGPDSLTQAQMTAIQDIFGQLSTSLTTLLGTSTDTNLSVNGNPSPAQPTIYGCLNDLNSFDGNITTDNQNLTTGKNGAAQEVNVLAEDEQKMTTAIATLSGEISTWTNDILASEIGIGVSIFVAVVGIALAVPTGGASLVATGIGVAGLGGSIAGAAVYSEKVTKAQDQIVSDQSKMTTDQQQVVQLNAIISAMAALGTLNQKAQSALTNMVDTYTSLAAETNTTLSDLQKADAAGTWTILVSIDIDDSVKAWGNLVTTAQGILNSTLHPQVLTPPAPTAP